MKPLPGTIGLAKACNLSNAYLISQGDGVLRFWNNEVPSFTRPLPKRERGVVAVSMGKEWAMK